MSRAKYAALAAIASAVGMCLSAAPAQADLVVRVQQGATTLTVQDNDANDQDLTIGSINVAEGALIGTFGDLDVGSSVTASSNIGTPDLFGNLSQTARLVRDNIAGVLDLTYTVVATQTDFLLPVGTAQMLSATAAATFTNAPTRASLTFTGSADPNNGQFVEAVSAPPIGPLSSISPLIENGAAGNSGPVFFNDVVPYSLTAESVINTTENSRIQITTSVRVDAAVVPEPSSMILSSLLAAAGLVGTRMRRRRAARAE
jgi:hypothetical protein